MSAATATAVRLRERVTVRGAMRSMMPMRASSSRAPAISASSMTGVSSAAPRTTAKRPAKETTRLHGGISSRPPATSKASPAPVIHGSARCVRSSTLERRMAPAGGTLVASHAGAAAATSAAATPISPPLTRVITGT